MPDQTNNSPATSAPGPEGSGADVSGGGGGLARVLGPVDATCIVIGAIIGVGIFFTPSQVARIAGSGDIALLAWAIGGGIALLGALTFAELGGLYPNNGGQYQILRDAYGPPVGFVYVFCNATAIQAGAAAIIAIICAKHLAGAVGSEIQSTSVLLGSSSLLIGGLVVANVIGVRWGSRIQNLTVYAKVLTLLAVTGLAIMTDGAMDAVAITPEATEATGPASSGSGSSGGWVGLMFAAMIPAFFSFGGWQHALWIGGEVRNARRNVPMAIVAGVIVVVVVYLLANWAYLHLLGYDGVVNSEALASDAVLGGWGVTGQRVISGAVAISAFGVLNAQFLSGPRLINGMARDGRFFDVFAHVNERFKTPLAAILLLGAMTFVLLFGAFVFFPDGTAAIDNLLTGVVIIDSTFFAFTGLALIILRVRRPDADRPVRVPLYPIVPALFVLGEVAMLTGSFLTQGNKRLFLLALAWIAAAGLFYWVFFQRERRAYSYRGKKTPDKP